MLGIFTFIFYILTVKYFFANGDGRILDNNSQKVMYQKIIQEVKRMGSDLPHFSGKIRNIGDRQKEVTEKDLEIEKTLSNIIKGLPGEHSVYAEEMHEEYLDTENVWVIDPISNTFNFIRGLPHYSVSLAHVYKKEIVFAVVYDPSTDELFTAEKGQGAFLNDQKISVTDNKLDLAILGGSHITPGRLKRSKIMTDIIKDVLFEKEWGTLRVMGSLALHYAYVACGRADVAISLNKDVFPEFAGRLLVEEAGGRFTDFSGKPLSVDTKTVLATNGKVHDELMGVLIKYDEEINNK